VRQDRTRDWLRVNGVRANVVEKGCAVTVRRKGG